MSQGEVEEGSRFERIRLLREEIRFEHQLIANRLSALLTVQPFLLAAFAFAATGEPRHHEHFIWFSYGVIPVIGLVVALVTLLAVVVGEQRLRHLRKSLYHEGSLADLAKLICPGLSRGAQAMSLSYAVALPVVFALAWIDLLAHGSG
jgi:hypothetical protein